MADDPEVVELDPAIDAVEPEVAAEEQALNPEQVLALLIQAPNIAVAIASEDDGQERLSAISTKVLEEYEIDLQSRKDWMDKNHDAMKLAMMVTEEKNYPFAKAANVKYPLIATAALQFN